MGGKSDRLLGRVSTITQFHQSKIAYTYDPADLALGTETVSSDLDHNGTDEFTRTLDRSHDTLGRNTGYDLKNGAAVEFSAIATYHPLSGRPFTVANGTQSFTYGYQPSSHLIATVVGPVHVATSNWEDHRDVLASKINALATGGTVRSSIYYTVNSLGQRTDATRGGPAPGTTHWDYDGLGQVVLANDSNNAADRVFQYDTIGNRKKSAVGTTLPGTDNYATNAVNQYTAIPSAPAAPLYDDDGNATTYPITPPGGSMQNASLVWDAENRLISTTPVGGSSTSYQYDALGRRIAKITANTPTVFLYDGWNLIAEYTGASLTLRASFLWGTDLSGTAQGAGGVGGLLAARLHKGSIGVYYPTYDGNGNITDYLNSTGGVAAHYEYGPFGEPLVSTGTVATQMPFRFSTKYQDAETGLLYYGYRYYDPNTGRWFSRDPITEKAFSELNRGRRPRIRSREERNVYAFVSSDPVNKVDPFGLKVLTKILVDFESSSAPNAVESVFFGGRDHPSSGRRFFGEMATFYNDATYSRYIVKTGGNVEIVSRIYKRLVNGKPAWDSAKDDTATPSGSYSVETTKREIGYLVVGTPGRSAIEIHFEGVTTGCIVFDQDNGQEKWKKFMCDMADTKAAGIALVPIKIWYAMTDNSAPPHGNRGDGADDPGGESEPWPDTEGPFEQPRH